VALGVHLAVASGAFAQRAPTDDPPIEPRTLHLEASDGARIAAHEYGAGTHAVVLVHGGRFDKSSWSAQAPALAEGGLRVLAIDLRGRGGSTHGTTPADSEDGYPLDVLAAVEYLRSTGAERVSLVGASFGGWAAAEAAMRPESGGIHRLVLIAASTVETPERLPPSTLFIVAADDPYADGSRRLDAIRRQHASADASRLVVLPGDAHAQHIFDTPQGPRLLAEIRDHLVR